MEKKIIAIITTMCLILVAALFVLNSPETNRSQENIKVGAIMPLTGDAAGFAGIPIQKAIMLATDEINANGGIDGRTLEIVYEDGACNNKEALTAAQKLINVNSVDVIIGGVCSGETLAAAPIAEESKVILFSPGSGSPDITNAGDYIFRNFPSDASSGAKIAQEAVTNNDLSIGVILESTDYARAVANVFETKFTELGGKYSEEIFLSDASDVKTQIMKIMETDPDAVYSLAQTEVTTIMVIKQLKELGFTGKIYSNEMVSMPEVQETLGDEVKGIVYAEVIFDSESKAVTDFMAKLTEQYGEQPLPPSYLSMAYDSVYIIKEAIEACGEVDSDCIKNNLYSIKNRQGIAGSLTIDSNGDADLEYEIKTVN